MLELNPILEELVVLFTVYIGTVENGVLVVQGGTWPL